MNDTGLHPSDPDAADRSPSFIVLYAHTGALYHEVYRDRKQALRHAEELAARTGHMVTLWEQVDACSLRRIAEWNASPRRVLVGCR